MSGVRETLNKRPGIAVGVFAAIVVLAVAVFYTTRDRTGEFASKAYYSDDDGASYFADDATKLYPFDHNGKQAYRAFVFRVGEGKPVVGYLAQYSDATKSKIATLRGKSDPESKALLTQTLATEYEVRKPGTTQWVSPNSPEASQVMTPPAGKTRGETVVGVMP